MPTPSFERDLMRRELRARRRELSTAERSLACTRFARVARSTRLFRPGRRIALYVAHGGEADPSALLQLARSLHCTVHLPVIASHRDCRMGFVPYEPGDRLAPNRYGIPEPVARRAPALVRSLDVIIVPLVAVDLCGTRLGSGAGFYDRALRHLCRARHWRRPKLIGLAYQFQLVERIPRRPWDVPLDAILTDKALYRARRSPTQQEVP